MGEIEIAGADALAAVQRITSNDAAKLKIGQAQYSGLMLPNGAFVDDLLVYRLAPDHFLLVVNASNVAKDFAWIREHIAGVGDAVAVDSSAATRSSPCRGRRRARSLQPLTGVDLGTIKYYWFAHGEVASVRGTISRTGYTGEDGYEMFVPPASAPACGTRCSRPAGRSTSSPRVSARATRCGWKPRCASTATTSTTRRRCSRPTSSGSCPGRRATSSAATALEAQKRHGLARRLVGFEMVDRAIARHGHPVLVDGVPAG